MIVPTIINVLGYKIYFWVNEGDPIEPLHVHISKKFHKDATKVWITAEGKCVLDSNRDKIPPKDLKQLIKTVEKFHDVIEEVWQQTFNEIKYII